MPAAAGPEIERLVQLLARLPGLGPRSARRAALFLIKKREQIMAPLAAAMQTALEKIEICRICGNIDTQNPCAVCADARRDPAIIVVVADVADLWALERAHAVNAPGAPRHSRQGPRRGTKDENPRDLWGRDAGAPRSLLSLLGSRAPPPGRWRSANGIGHPAKRSTPGAEKE